MVLLTTRISKGKSILGGTKSMCQCDSMGKMTMFLLLALEYSKGDKYAVISVTAKDDRAN